jgi:hypothetical protein
MTKKAYLLLFAFALIFGASCKKDPNYGKIKYEVTVSSAVNLNIDYTNGTGNTNTVDITGSTWTKEIDNATESGDVYYLDVSSYGQSGYTITSRIYYEGKIVEEEIDDNTNGSGWTYSYLSFAIPSE